MASTGNEMELELADVPDSEFEQRFAAVKQGIFPYVEAVFGWDDEFQRERLTCAYQPQWFSWILQGGERVGLLCCKPYEDALHVHLLIIFPQYQGRQLGAAVMALPSWRGFIARRSVRENAV